MSIKQEEITQVKDYLGKRTLITGDVNSGKTTLTRNILDAFCRERLDVRIAIIDLGPEIPPGMAVRKSLNGVGGKLKPTAEGAWIYLTDRIRPPRLTAGSDQEAILIAQDNAGRIDYLFQQFMSSGRDILFVNDITLYLQAGPAIKILAWMDKAGTVVANGYKGRKLGAGTISQKEAKELNYLLRHFDRHIRMPGFSMKENRNGRVQK